MKTPACCVLIASLVLLSGCSLRQSCCSSCSYHGAVVTTPSISHDEPTPDLDPTPPIPDVQAPAEQAPAERAPAERAPAEQAPAAEPAVEEARTSSDRPLRRATRNRLVPAQNPPTSY